MTKGERIKLRREEMGLSQTDVAKSLGVTKQTIYKYEKDIITNIPSDVLEDLSRVLNCPPSYIMGWDESLNVVPRPVSTRHVLSDTYVEPDSNNHGHTLKLKPTPTMTMKRILAYASKIVELPEDKRKQIFDYIDYIIEKE